MEDVKTIFCWRSVKMDERYFRFDNEEDVQLEFYLSVDAECRAPKRNTLLWDEWGDKNTKKAHTQSVQCKRGMGEPIIHILFSSGGCSPTRKRLHRQT